MLTTLRAKVLALTAGSLLVMTVAVVGIAAFLTERISDQVTAAVDSYQTELYTARLGALLDEIRNSHASLETTLKETGLAGTDAAEGYHKEAQDSTLAQLAKKHYGSKALTNNDPYFYIVDDGGTVVMHPRLKRGDGSLVNLPFMREVLKQDDANLVYEYQNVRKWVLARPFAPWKWRVAYALPEEAKYARVRDIGTMLSGMQWQLAAVVFGACLLVTFALGAFLTHMVIRPLGGEPSYALDVVRRIAKGDLGVDVKIRANDESSLLYAMRSMRTSLAGIITRINRAADTISTGTQEIASGNADLSQRTEGQASSLEETASSMEELTSTVRQNAENARQANQLAIGASEVAVRGGQVVGQVVTTMSSINESSRKIVDIISVIDGIAFQTNILALNAAVEAARAGEQGRGFAVVATEVRTLAQRSAAAAKEIKALIGDSVDKVESGTKLVDVAGNTMAEIVTAVKRVTDIMAEITAASQEQSAGIEQVNKAITQMDEVTQQNAALVEQATAAAESLAGQADELQSAIAVFTLVEAENHQAAAIASEAEIVALPVAHPDPETGPTKLAMAS
jgi:methyl-accepting chemotaxis protein